MVLIKTSKVPFWKYLVVTLMLSISNLRLLWLFDFLSILSFIIGECLIVLFLYFIFKNEDIIQHFRDDYRSYHAELMEKIPALKYESYAVVVYTASIVCAGLFPCVFTIALWAVINLLYLCLLFYLSKKKREHRYLLKNYFNFPSKGSLSSKGNSRLVHTWAKTGVLTCVECFKYGVPLVGVAFTGGLLMPKVAYGMDYRSPMANFIGYSFTGLTSSSELIYGVGVKLTNTPQKAHLKALIVGDDGHTIDPRKLLNDASKFKLSKAMIDFLEESVEEYESKDK